MSETYCSNDALLVAIPLLSMPRKEEQESGSAVWAPFEDSCNSGDADGDAGL